jgi:hypothetical protein
MIFIKAVKITLLVKNEDVESTLSEIENLWQYNCNKNLRFILNIILKSALPHRLHKLTIGKRIVIKSFFAQLCHKNKLFVDHLDRKMGE